MPTDKKRWAGVTDDEEVECEEKTGAEGRGKWVKDLDALIAGIAATHNLNHFWTLPFYCVIHGGGQYFPLYIE